MQSLGAVGVRDKGVGDKGVGVIGCSAVWVGDKGVRVLGCRVQSLSAVGVGRKGVEYEGIGHKGIGGTGCCSSPGGLTLTLALGNESPERLHTSPTPPDPNPKVHPA